MGQKVHPLGFRLGITQEHQSHWFAKKSMYPILVLEDRLIRLYCNEKYADAGIITINISRKVDHIHIDLAVARPKVLVGSRGQDLENVRQELLQELLKFRQKKWSANQLATTTELRVTLHVTKVENPNTSANILADDLAEQLEKRIPFRRAMKTVLQRAEREKIPGIKIQVSGRLNGAEIARTEWIRKGRVPLHTLQAKIDYRARTAKTIYGLLGIKIWLYKGMTNELSVNS
jgi:small subunit ribosomal protein S3